MSRPWGTKLWPKFEILKVLGAVFPYFCPDFAFIGAMCRPCREKTHFGPMSKNNTGMAASMEWIDRPVRRWRRIVQFPLRNRHHQAYQSRTVQCTTYWGWLRDTFVLPEARKCRQVPATSHYRSVHPNFPGTWNLVVDCNSRHRFNRKDTEYFLFIVAKFIDPNPLSPSVASLGFSTKWGTARVFKKSQKFLHKHNKLENWTHWLTIP